MACKTVLIAGVFYALGCNAVEGGTTETLKAPAPAELPAAAAQATTTRRTGLTLKDVVRDMEWRKKAFDRMAQND
ncbi:MAG: hypothetical protein P8X75_11680 [Limibacillus sp.]|jgi:hypothetical protein